MKSGLTKLFVVVGLVLALAGVARASDFAPYYGIWQLDGWVRGGTWATRNYRYYVEPLLFEVGDKSYDEAYADWQESDLNAVYQALYFFINGGDFNSAVEMITKVPYLRLVNNFTDDLHPGESWYYEECWLPYLGRTLDVYARTNDPNYDLVAGLLTSEHNWVKDSVSFKLTCNEDKSECKVTGSIHRADQFDWYTIDFTLKKMQ